MSIHRLFASLSLAVISLTSLAAEPRCPQQATGQRLRIVQGAMIIVSLRINQGGTYDFLVDTGAQISIVDRSLASELGLKTRGTTGVGGVATFGRYDFAYLDQVQTAGKSVTDLLVVVQELAQLKVADPRIRGVLGDNFLERFDLLIDNHHHILCLDNLDSLAVTATGQHIPLAEPYGPSDDLPFTRPIVVAVKVHSFRETPILLRLDSGSNIASLHLANPQTRKMSDSRTTILRRVVEGIEQVFLVLPGQDVEVGAQRFYRVPFVVPMNSVGHGPGPREDGVLPTIAFRRVFISSAGHFAALEPW
jgi:hypothetical protein